MKCPFCQNKKTRVVDSRELNEGFTVRRRRICPECKTRFTTYEALKIQQMKVLKRNNKYEPFNRDKIVESINKACIKLPIKAEYIEEIIREVEGRIWRNSSREISSIEIGEIILNHLKEAHPLAYLRFASVFNEWKSLDDLINVTLKLKRELVPEDKDLFDVKPAETVEKETKDKKSTKTTEPAAKSESKAGDMKVNKDEDNSDDPKSDKPSPGLF